MLNFVCKKTITELVDVLSDNIKSSCRGKGLFDSPTHKIIIPSLVNRTWIDLELAKRNVVVTQISYDTLKWSLLRLAKEMNAEDLAEKLTERDIFASLLVLLSEKQTDKYITDDSIKQYIREYLGYGSNSNSKKDALAQKLTSLFVKYSEEAPELFNELKEPEKIASDNQNKKLQAYLYTGLTQVSGFDDFDNFSFSVNSIAKTDKLIIHVIGYTYIPDSVMQKLDAMSQKVAINVYREEPSSLRECNTPLAADWAKIEKKADEIFRKYDKNQSIASGCKQPFPLSKDKIHIAACKGAGREAEFVWNSICHNLNTRKDLKPSDICILVCDTQNYYYEIERVFSWENNRIPINTTCIRPAPNSNYLSGILSLFDILGSNMERFRLEKLFTNRCFLNKFNLTDEEVREWFDDMEQLGAWEFFDKDEKAASFSALADAPLHTWKNTAMRIRLAAAAAEPWQNIYPAENTDTPSDTSSKLASIVELLHSHLQAISEADKAARTDSSAATDDAFDLMSDFIDTYLRSEDSESSMKSFTASRLESFKRQCSIRNFVPLSSDICSFIKTTMNPMQFHHSRPFTEGIMTGHIKNIKMPCFKILYLMGFNEDNFPGQTIKDSMDLTQDAVTERELNHHAFYKAAACAEEVYITYNSKDRVTDTEMYRSTAVTDLIKIAGINKDTDILKPNLFARTDILNKEEFPQYHKKDYEEARAEAGYYNEENTDTDSHDVSNNSDNVTKLTISRLNTFLKNPIESYLNHHLGLGDYSSDEHHNFIPSATSALNKWKYQRPAYTEYIKNNSNSWEEAVKKTYEEYTGKGLAPEGLLSELEKYKFCNDCNDKNNIDEYLQSTPCCTADCSLKCRIGNFTITGKIPAVLTNEDCSEIRIFLPKKLKEFRNFIEAYIITAAYITANNIDTSSTTVYISGIDKEYPFQNDNYNVQEWLTELCKAALDPQACRYTVPGTIAKSILDDKLTKELIDNNTVPADTAYLLKSKCLEDLAKQQHPTHYWHRLIKDNPNIIEIPQEEELKKALLRIVPLVISFDTTTKK